MCSGEELKERPKNHLCFAQRFAHWFTRAGKNDENVHLQLQAWNFLRIYTLKVSTSVWNIFGLAFSIWPKLAKIGQIPRSRKILILCSCLISDLIKRRRKARPMSQESSIYTSIYKRTKLSISPCMWSPGPRPWTRSKFRLPIIGQGRNFFLCNFSVALHFEKLRGIVG